MNKFVFIIGFALFFTGCSSVEIVRLPLMQEPEDEFISGADAEPVFGEGSHVFDKQSEPLSMQEYAEYINLLNEVSKTGVTLENVQGDALDQLHVKMENTDFGGKLQEDKTDILSHFIN